MLSPHELTMITSEDFNLGAILIASGRVPNTVNIFFTIYLHPINKIHFLNYHDKPNRKA